MQEYFWLVLCWEVCPLSECPLSEVSLYYEWKDGSCTVLRLNRGEVSSLTLYPGKPL